MLWKICPLLLVGGLAAAQEFGDEIEPATDPWQVTGDLRLRYDHLDFPGARPSIERSRAALRGGLLWDNDGSIEFAVAAKLSVTSDGSGLDTSTWDNEKGDALLLDKLYVSFWASREAEIRAGKSELMAVLTPMVWDRDIRPAGLTARGRHPVREFDELEWVVGYMSGEHEFDREPNLGVAQLSWLLQPGAANSGEISLGYIEFSNLETIPRSGLGRTNTRVGGRLVNDYQLGNLTLTYNWQMASLPWFARLDMVHNFGADDKNQGARFEIVGGNAARGGWEYAVAYQRVQKDAVLAAFNEDDWWFPTDMRGVMPWISYGFTDGVWLRAAAFLERRDGAAKGIERYMLDLNWEF